MEERSEGIILRTGPLTDTSLIVQWLTPLGRLSTVAKGARRPKSIFTGKLDLFYEADFSFQRSRRSELHALREVQVTNTRSALRSHLPLFYQASYFTALIELGTERDTPLPEIYALFADYLRHLPAIDRIPEALFVFEFQFLCRLGFAPGIKNDLLKRNFAELQPLSRDERNNLNRVLRTAVGTAFERLPPQRQLAIDAWRA